MGISPLGAVELAVIAKQFDELREVGLPSEHILDSALVEVKAVRGQLEPVLRQSGFQVGQKPICGLRAGSD